MLLEERIHMEEKGVKCVLEKNQILKANSALDQVEGTNMYRASGEEESMELYVNQYRAISRSMAHTNRIT